MGKSYRHADESYDDADYSDIEYDERERRKAARQVRDAKKHTREFQSDEE